MNEKHETLLQKLGAAIGGEWRPTPIDCPITGYMAEFPRFRSDAVVGVINDAAERAGLGGQAVAIGYGMGDMGLRPDAPRQVIIPKALAEHRHFQQKLESGMKRAITDIVSRQLSYYAGQGQGLYR